MAASRAGYACMFPGQGSQSVGMLDAMFAANEEVGRTFAQASGVLDQDLEKLVREGPVERLNATVNTQPVMLTASVALWRVWRRRRGVPPGWMCGHSVGEYAALVCAGALDFEDALRLVRRRAELMQQATDGRLTAMAAVLGADGRTLERSCTMASENGSVVEAVNYNAPGQIVVAGHGEAVERLAHALSGEGGVRFVPLSVSVPAHSSLMKDAALRYAEVLESTAFTSPEVPVIHNIDARPRSSEAGIRLALARQIDHPVQWVHTIRSLLAEGMDACLEVGPGRVLCGLNRRIDKKIKNHSLGTPDDLEAAQQKLDQDMEVQ